ncbi:hypothetical protein GCM10010361_54420 [Streptomyces olivaceiscleroticus]|uniref:Uncharacterized protein n=1 Tax=Streptomyces olivaceiscleroticus TaxID=68245 RepID=A0ABN1AS06_9ACTN
MAWAGAELGEDPPALQVREAVLDRRASDGEDAVGVLLASHRLAEGELNERE